MDEQQRITFVFDGHMEVQYLGRFPEVGHFVSHNGELWTVTSIETDAVGALVVCEPPPVVGPQFAEAGKVGVPWDTST